MLRHISSGREERLTAEHTVGRSNSNLLRLETLRASGHHALLRWTGESWELCDLGSRNGTWIGGYRLDAGQRQLVLQGHRVAFGQEDEEWVLADAAAPVLSACSESGRWIEAEDGLLILPDATQPEVVIYGDDQGRWVVEQAAARWEWVFQEAALAVTAAGQRWRVFPPSTSAPTRTHASLTGPVYALDVVTLIFRVSRDEEHVDLELRLPEGQPSLHVPHRAQHYLLLTLARAREEDAADPDLPPAEQGWRYRDDLCRGLRIPENQFNVTIFRARQHLSNAGLVGADDIVERRRGSGQLRLGTERILIEGL